MLCQQPIIPQLESNECIQRHQVHSLASGATAIVQISAWYHAIEVALACVSRVGQRVESHWQGQCFSSKTSTGLQLPRNAPGDRRTVEAPICWKSPAAYAEQATERSKTQGARSSQDRHSLAKSPPRRTHRYRRRGHGHDHCRRRAPHGLGARLHRHRGVLKQNKCSP